jgi:hypothetical protein
MTSQPPWERAAVGGQGVAVDQGEIATELEQQQQQQGLAGQLA